MPPDRLAQELVDRGQLGVAVTEVLRAKALDLLTERATVTDEAGNPVDVKAITAEAKAEAEPGDDAEAGADAEAGEGADSRQSGAGSRERGRAADAGAGGRGRRGRSRGGRASPGRRGQSSQEGQGGQVGARPACAESEQGAMADYAGAAPR